MPPTDRVLIDLDDIEALLGQMRRVHASGSGWLNLLPVIDPDTPVPATPSALAVFSKRGPAVPLVTWTPATGGSRPEPTTLGVQHGVGSALAARLPGTAAAIPEGWRVVSDHPRRGLVVQVPGDVDESAVAAWLLHLVDTVSVVPHTGRVEVFLYP